MGACNRIFNITVNDIDAKKSAHYIRVLVVTEFVVSGTLCTCKVMFSQASVILFTGGVSVPTCTTGHINWINCRLYPGGVSVWGSLSGGFLSRESLSRGGLYKGDPPYGNERAVRILLECILVW